MRDFGQITQETCWNIPVLNDSYATLYRELDTVLETGKMILSQIKQPPHLTHRGILTEQSNYQPSPMQPV